MNSLSEDQIEMVIGKLDKHSEWLEEYLTAFMGTIKDGKEGYHPFISEQYDAISEYLMRTGKRIASFTTSLVCEGYGVENRKVLERVCGAIELYRHSILIHDDLVDADDQRRGKPTIHARFTSLRDPRLGMGCAVFQGNILFCLSMEMINGSDLEPTVIQSLLKELIGANTAVNESQILDVYMEGRDSSLQEWKAMASKRAASLFRATMKMGGIVANIENELVMLAQAGELMGFVFDIQDDIIDTFATREQYGRKPGSDISTRKRPLHVVLALEQADDDQKKILRSPKSDLKSFRSALKDTNGVARAKRMAEKYKEKALRTLDKTNMDQETKNLFSGLMSYMDQSLNWYL